MQVNTVILGAGAAGMMCAAHTGGSTLVVDHAKAPGEKIRISGGGRCNFTNLYADPSNYLSGNPHFCKSAMARYTQWDFISLVDRHGIAWHEKTLGQLFCDGSAKQIVSMLTSEMAKAGAELWLQTSVGPVEQRDDGFALTLTKDGKDHHVTCRNLVLATGGKSIPKMGATGLAYDIARQFALPVTVTRPGLVPFTFPEGRFSALAGVSLPARLSNARASFDEALLFTHRGLSGPAVLQLSSYWQEGEEITVNLAPETDIFAALRSQRQIAGKRAIATELARHLPARLVDYLKEALTPAYDLTARLADQSDAALQALCDQLNQWQLTPGGTEGYRTAEVTLGGIDTDALSSKTMQAKSRPGLYAIGEAVDVTGWLGGYNFQWAWASGHAAGTAIAATR
ncbi:NAD(P)/FAD-dependent oxidoreductase [Phaeobacter gallaeciensis]|uniref:NAD(P)/FAD-dependent oxidoreductase n=1 Tax=Phaeobacter gallaeciensis TaxID=60890 RepID=UPI002380BC61|nr:NAD(P)/FAD-dependent oxidoreductase [Phaeobacter gallaeciensis]MDE4275453.1 NAD(P)/FAD-dependent oxidoreductase [Phaeobacter gallaeciensis]MDE4300796.1 NAD(P)/FAD-dependent oxidoreductase [Phaeobacter gallaeciensis]MDE5185960.1 NAD(P)/FAD-dependent oxidoreductase [Phaeobacter gallaeciensis]MEC9310974.1 NAD(P)/FAD-dependent oxidoreductase [Pseudomonadota bacterium]